MRPTIDDQLDGARRLVTVVEEDAELSVASRESLENLRRLLDQIARSWAALPAFYASDNATLGRLLSDVAPAVSPALADEIRARAATTDGPIVLDVRASGEWNAELRRLLSRVIEQLPRTGDGGAARTQIAEYLRQRVRSDPS